jgi:hypothetical protein
MHNSKEMPKKLAVSVKYYWSFEFQLWSMIGLDDEARREELASSAAREFIREIHELVPADDTFISPTSKDNNEQDFLALATTLHEVNDKQKNRVDKASIQRFSMLYLIERALDQKTQIDEGKITMAQLAPSSYDLLGFESKLVQLLQARHNFLMTMWLAKASDIDKSFWKKINLGLLGSSWDFDLSKFNDVEVSEMKKYLKAAKEARDILTRNGHEVVVDETVLKVSRNVRMKMTKSNDTVRAGLESQILEYWTELTK